jgi:hypothetical protein
MSLKRLQTMQKKLRRNSTGNLRKVGRGHPPRVEIDRPKARRHVERAAVRDAAHPFRYRGDVFRMNPFSP